MRRQPHRIPYPQGHGIFGSVEILSFQQIANHLLSEGTVPVPPNRPCAFAMVLYYFLWNYRSRGDASAAGAEALRAVAPKSVERNSMRISIEPNFSIKIF
jgi:hypothetical protein